MTQQAVSTARNEAIDTHQVFSAHMGVGTLERAGETYADPSVALAFSAFLAGIAEEKRITRVRDIVRFAKQLEKANQQSVDLAEINSNFDVYMVSSADGALERVKAVLVPR